jgi:hypothetical protein
LVGLLACNPTSREQPADNIEANGLSRKLPGHHVSDMREQMLTQRRLDRQRDVPKTGRRNVGG